MRLDDLNYFLAVAEAGHVGRAAEQVGATQPALTKGIQRLERELQLQLFERTPKGMELTSVGKVFFQRARNVRFGLDEAIKEASDLHLGNVGLVRAGCPPNYADFFSAACTELHQQRPAAKMQVMIGLNDGLFSALRAGDLDMCVSAIQQTPSGEFDQKLLFEDRLFAVARENHPVFYASGLRFADLSRESWILPGPNVAARRAIDARFLEHGLPPPNVVIESNTSVTSLIGIVKASNLMAVTSESVLKRAVGRGIRKIPLSEMVWRRQVGLSTRRGAYLSPLTRRFIELLEEHAGRFASEHPVVE